MANQYNLKFNIDVLEYSMEHISEGPDMARVMSFFYTHLYQEAFLLLERFKEDDTATDTDIADLELLCKELMHKMGHPERKGDLLPATKKYINNLTGSINTYVEFRYSKVRNRSKSFTKSMKGS